MELAVYGAVIANEPDASETTWGQLAEMDDTDHAQPRVYDSDFDETAREVPTDVAGLSSVVHELRNKLLYTQYNAEALMQILSETNQDGSLSEAVCKCRACFLSKRFCNGTTLEDLHTWPFHWTDPPRPCIVKCCLLDKCAQLGITFSEEDEDAPDKDQDHDLDTPDAHLLIVTDDGMWSIWYEDLFPIDKEEFAHHPALGLVKALFEACANSQKFFRHSDGTNYVNLTDPQGCHAEARVEIDGELVVPDTDSDDDETETDSIE